MVGVDDAARDPARVRLADPPDVHLRRRHHGPGGIDLNGIVALLGTVFLFFGLKLLWEHRARVPLTAWVWTVCVAVLALTSAKTPPNPRLLILAFPVVMAVGAVLAGARVQAGDDVQRRSSRS